MYSLGAKPNVYTQHCHQLSLPFINQTVFGFSVLGLMFKLGIEPDMVILTTLINGLCLEGKNVAQAVSFLIIWKTWAINSTMLLTER